MHKPQSRTATIQSTSITRPSRCTCGRFVLSFSVDMRSCGFPSLYWKYVCTRWKRSVSIWAGCWTDLLALLLTAMPTRERWFSTGSWSPDSTFSSPAPTSQEPRPAFSSGSFPPLPSPSGKIIKFFTKLFNVSDFICAIKTINLILSAMKSPAPPLPLTADSEWETSYFHGSWVEGKTAGGSRNFLSHWQNPCFPFTVSDDPAVTSGVNVRVTLHQSRPDTDLHPIGFHIYKVSKIQSQSISVSLDYVTSVLLQFSLYTRIDFTSPLNSLTLFCFSLSGIALSRNICF